MAPAPKQLLTFEYTSAGLVGLRHLNSPTGRRFWGYALECGARNLLPTGCPPGRDPGQAGRANQTGGPSRRLDEPRKTLILVLIFAPLEGRAIITTIILTAGFRRVRSAAKTGPAIVLLVDDLATVLERRQPGLHVLKF